jgi:hypothetical protein
MTMTHEELLAKTLNGKTIGRAVRLPDGALRLFFKDGSYLTVEDRPTNPTEHSREPTIIYRYGDKTYEIL